MDRASCPPFIIDKEVARLLEVYQQARGKAAEARKKRATIRKAGHYDQDASMPRATEEDPVELDERRAAVAVADSLLGWMERHPPK